MGQSERTESESESENAARARVSGVQGRRPTRRAAQAARRREQLLDTALDLFAEQGIENTTIKDIAARAGVAQGLVYHYFRSKDELFGAIVARYSPVEEARVLLADLAGTPPEEGLRQFAHAAYHLLREREKLLRVALREMLTRPEIRAAQRMIRDQMVALVGDYLRSGVASGRLREHDPAVVVQMFGGALLTSLVFETPEYPFVDELVDTLLHGLLADKTS